MARDDDDKFGLSIPGVSSPQVNKKKLTREPINDIYAHSRGQIADGVKKLLPQFPDEATKANAAKDRAPINDIYAHSRGNFFSDVGSEVKRLATDNVLKYNPLLQATSPSGGKKYGNPPVPGLDQAPAKRQQGATFVEDWDYAGNGNSSTEAALTRPPGATATQTPAPESAPATASKVSTSKRLQEEVRNASPLFTAPLSEALQGQQAQHIKQGMEGINDYASLNPKLAGRAAEQRVMEEQFQRQNGNFGANSGIVSSYAPAGTRGNPNAYGQRVNEDPNVKAEITRKPGDPIEIIRGNPHAARSFNISTAQEDAEGNFYESSAQDNQAKQARGQMAKLSRTAITKYGTQEGSDALEMLLSLDQRAGETSARLGVSSYNAKKGNSQSGSELDSMLVATGITAEQIAVMSEAEKLEIMAYGAPDVDTTSEYLGGNKAKDNYTAAMIKLMNENPDEYSQYSPEERQLAIDQKWAASAGGSQ